MDRKCNQCSKKESQKESESFALQLVRAYSAQVKRWFIACLIILSLLIGTIAGFIWTLQRCEKTVEGLLVEYTSPEAGSLKNTDIMEYYEKN